MKLQYLVVAVALGFSCHAMADEKADKAAMEAMEKAGQPGDAHKKLDALAGKFTVKSKMWMDPSKPPEESSASTERTWIMGKRYLQENYKGTFMGQAFTGMGIQGYDNVTKHYFGSWIDSGSTSMSLSTGTLKGNTITYKGKMSDPAVGKEVPYTMTLKIVDNDHHTLEMSGTGPKGKEVKWMELQYTRTQ
jgi:hypothetical protein